MFIKNNIKKDYQNYFKEHYKSSFSELDILLYKKFFYPQYQFILSKIQMEPTYKILEIGSGIGGGYSLLSEAARKNYTGLELDADAVNFAVNYFNSNTFLNESLEEFESNCVFDIVYAFEVLEHFDNPIENIRKISRLLKDNGVFIGTSPYPYAKNVFADKTHNFVLHPENWKRLFLKNGFKKVDVYPMSFFPVIWRFNTHFHVRIPFYVPFPYFISTTLIIGHR